MARTAHDVRRSPEPSHLVALSWLVGGLVLVRDRDAGARRILRLVRRGGGDRRRGRLFRADGSSSRSSFCSRVLVIGAGADRPAGLRLVRRGPRAAAPKPRACDDRGRFSSWTSDRARLRRASGSATVPGASPGRIARPAPRSGWSPWSTGRSCASSGSDSSPQRIGDSALSGRPAPEWSSASAPWPFRCRAVAPRSRAARARP